MIWIRFIPIHPAMCTELPLTLHTSVKNPTFNTSLKKKKNGVSLGFLPIREHIIMAYIFLGMTYFDLTKIWLQSITV